MCNDAMTRGLSHQMKNGLTDISLRIQTLELRLDGLRDAIPKEYHKAIENDLAGMNNVVNNMTSVLDAYPGFPQGSL